MTINRRFVVLIAISVLPIVAGGSADAVNKDGKVAIKGYDPVAYFSQGAALKGSPNLAHEWMGAIWQFSSAGNRDLFVKNPEVYAPQYGGYCAYGVSQGHTVSVDPEAWKIVDGKLYLNYSKSVQKTWSGNIPGYIDQANKNWPGLHK
jgi:hypothetical protein